MTTHQNLLHFAFQTLFLSLYYSIYKLFLIKLHIHDFVLHCPNFKLHSSWKYPFDSNIIIEIF